MVKTRLQKVVIVGGGIVGWTVASALVNALQRLDIKILLLSGNTIDEPFQLCESATPAMVAFNSILGVNEKNFISSTRSSYQLAIEYNWGAERGSYFMPFAEHGFMLNRLNFSNYAVYARLMGDHTPYYAYSLSAMAAKSDRFCLPSQTPNSLFSTLNYGFQLSITGYVNYLRNYAMSLGVEEQIVDGPLGVYLEESKGNIKHVTFKDIDKINSIVDADLYIDCTGQKALLIDQALNVRYKSLAHQLPLNRVLTLQERVVKPYPSSSGIKLTSSGWLKRVSTQEQNQRSYYYHTDFTPDEVALSVCESNADEASFQINQLQPGQRDAFWAKNCIAVGGAAGSISDLVIGALHLVQSAALRIVTLFPGTKEFEFHAKEYNRLTALEYSHIIDFHQLHFRLGAELHKSSYWDAIKTMATSESLEHRLSMFSYRGMIPFHEGETLPAGTWISFLIGAGKWPSSYDPAIDSMTNEWIYQNLIKMKSMIQSAVGKIPTQDQFLQRFQ